VTTGRVELGLRPAVPALVLRVLAGVCALLAVGIVGYEGWQTGTGLWGAVGAPRLAWWSLVAGVVVSGWVVWRPQDHLAPLLALGVGVAVLLGPAGITWRTHVLAALVLVVLRCSALAAGLGWWALVEVDVLRAEARSTLGVLLLVVLVGTVGPVVGAPSASLVPVRLAGALAAAVLAAWLLPVRRSRRGR